MYNIVSVTRAAWFESYIPVAVMTEPVINDIILI